MGQREERGALALVRDGEVGMYVVVIYEWWGCGIFVVK